MASLTSSPCLQTNSSSSVSCRRIARHSCSSLTAFFTSSSLNSICFAHPTRSCSSSSVRDAGALRSIASYLSCKDLVSMVDLSKDRLRWSVRSSAPQTPQGSCSSASRCRPLQDAACTSLPSSMVRDSTFRSAILCEAIGAESRWSRPRRPRAAAPRAESNAGVDRVALVLRCPGAEGRLCPSCSSGPVI